ncbi:hypothetical protein KI688_004894 [Linnemannia hyalina]|uniref:Uncharacterized protein n=1 Tax=Linnemannia hyalina TaxID=64524 RepID=A0A9P8BR61_9FUNG|nr:hypothetical protein KI688_004894 [Linnemannia hyalina]
MNWTGGRRTKIQANAERMRRRQRFDRQCRLARATYYQDLQQRSSIIPDHGQSPSQSPLTARHRTPRPSNEKFSPLFVKMETDGSAASKTCDAHQVRQQDPTSTAAGFSPRASLASGRSTQGDTSLVARGLDLGTMDYHTARLECLKILKSPSFDWLGEAYQLRPSELLERNITPPNQTSRNPCKRAHQSFAVRRAGHSGRTHGVEDDDAGYSPSDSGADDEDEGDEDELLQVPAKHRAVCRELQTKRSRIDIDVDNMIIQPQESAAKELVIETPPHSEDITKEETGQNRVTPADEASLSRNLTPVYTETIAEHQTVNPVEGNSGHGSDMPSKTTLSRGADPPVVEPTSPTSVFADSSAPVDQAMPNFEESQFQVETNSQARQSLSIAPREIKDPQEPSLKDPREPDNRSLETRDIGITSAFLATTDARATGIYAMDINSAAIDETGLQPVETPTKEQHSSASQLPKSPTPGGRSPASHTAEPTVVKPQPTEIPPAEARLIGGPAPHVTLAPRLTHSHFFPTYGSANLPDRRRDNNSGVTSVQETEQRPVEMYSQSVPSEMDAPLYSDGEETPYQSNSHNSPNSYTYNNRHNNSINQEDDYIDPNDVSPEVSTQYTLSKQSSVVSAFDWFPANQEQASRISLQEKEHRSQSTLMRSDASNPQTVGNSGYIYDDYDSRGGGSFSSSSQLRSRGVHAHEQEQRRQHQRVSLIRLPSDPMDVDALSSILGSQDDFGYGHHRGGGGGGGTGSGGAIQGLRSEFERGESAEGGEDDALSEWIHDDEW